MKKRTVALIAALVLLVGCVVGGTIAWLTDKTDPVTNTFTAGDIDITLTEEDAVDGKQSFKMVPGDTITKKADVTVLANSEDCWLFVKVDKSGNYDTYLSKPEMADGWEELETGVYYREVSASTSHQGFDVLMNDQVKVLDTVTKAQMEAIKNSGQPTLTFTAYAIQKLKFDKAVDAWAEVKTLG